MGRLDDDGNLVVVMVTEPVEEHVVNLARLAEKQPWSNSLYKHCHPQSGEC
jgi:hypothetical protein